MRLRRSVLSGPGIARKRRGKGFAYHGPDGELLSDEDTLQRIKGLVIPPAWKKVWISSHRNGHIQDAGTDAAGRRQYLYHPAWQQERAEEKFDRVRRHAVQFDYPGKSGVRHTVKIDDAEVVRAIGSLIRPPNAVNDFCCAAMVPGW